MKKVLLCAISFLIIYSCDHTPVVTSEELDDSLTLLIKAHSPTASKDYFVMPESIDLHHLPNQDKKNSINEAKVRLGNLLFFETGLGMEAKYDVSLKAYSCSS
ncbi:MAG: hypothetical protein KA143_02180, partial [Saprospiraceae bacterium]|nr:hypothetical protein [Saprospiraceae bacterium]